MFRGVLDLGQIGRTQVAAVGGKGAHLGELSRIAGVSVPAGFCVTTDAFRRTIAAAPAIGGLIERLSRLAPEDGAALAALGAEIRGAIGAAPMPAELAAAIGAALERLGGEGAWAVRSSATAEDLPMASFAGQHDSFLGVAGAAEVLSHVRLCWASLFTERALVYRQRAGIGHPQVAMGVVVQRMVVPQAAGLLFTADPLSGNRKVSTVEAVFGLGEALVSGQVNADVYRVREGAIVSRQQRSAQPVLSDEQVLDLAVLGRRIEAHFGAPQDVEYCLADGRFEIVQSRPITTLFPLPAAADGGPRFYVSVGHQQMMTDAMKPLGLSIWQLITPRPMAEAGGRLFVDVTAALASPANRAGLLAMLGKSDPLIGDALSSLLEREDFPLPPPPAAAGPAAAGPGAAPAPIATDGSIAAGLIARSEASLAALRREIDTRTGGELLAFIRADLAELRRFLFDPLSLQVVMAGMEAAWWLNRQLEEWLGEKNAADRLSLSVPHNVTAEMGLALAGALAGLAVSAGTVEGRARVVLDLAAARLEPGDILVTTATDPGWTVLFVAIAGLVTEVGGLMTHGAVIAREYGLPAVVGVENATRLIRDGQSIRLHGSYGYVELL